MIYRLRTIITLIGALLGGCSGSPKYADIPAAGIASVGGAYALQHPDDRANDRPRYFEEEFKAIRARRAQNGFTTGEPKGAPDHLLALALSGGGIRSNAYHLGMLSGLTRVSYLERPLLNRIDYLSSVSGGSWAAGGYWAYAGSDKELFGCLDEAAQDQPKDLNAQCAVVAAMLRTDQGNAIIPKESWTNAIIQSHLLGKDSDLVSGPLPPHGPERPFPIFNGSHDVAGEKESAKNFPLQVTALEFGTLVDCSSAASEEPCSERKGGAFFSLSSPNLRIVRHHSFGTDDSGFKLSEAMHASSAVIDRLLGIKMRVVTKNGEVFPGAREEYRLADGGKSDNLGLVSLVERGPQLIIVSDMAEDPKQSFASLDTSSKQTSLLLNRRLEQAEITTRIRKGERSAWSTYFEKGGKEEGKVFYVKPGAENITDFVDWLREQNQHGRYLQVSQYLLRHLEEPSDNADDISGSQYAMAEDFDEKRKMYEDLDETSQPYRKHFPQTPTFKPRYKPQLIRAYYLLGRYVAMYDIAPAICEWLQSDKENSLGSGHARAKESDGSSTIPPCSSEPLI